MSCRNRGVEDRAEQGTPVGHFCAFVLRNSSWRDQISC
jgi:hypothetical protein